MSLVDIAQVLGGFAELIGAIAVVVTLVYLARQLRHNTASVSASAYQMWLSSNVHINIATAQEGLSEVLGPGLYDSKRLTEETFIKFALWNHSVFQLIQATHYLYKSGALDHALWESEIHRAAVHLGLPGVRQWWDAGGRTQLTPEFAALVESTEPEVVRWAWNPDEGYVPDGPTVRDEG